MGSAIKQIIADVHERVRIDTYLSRVCPAYSRSYFKRLIRQKLVSINGAPCLSSHRVKHGEKIRVTFALGESSLIPEDTPLDILHEDKDILVLNKPSGMVVHPAAGHRTGTLAHAIAGYIGSHTQIKVVDPLRPGIVHRLDKNTSGVMVVAKTLQAHNYLGKQFAAHLVKKQYLAIVHGKPEVQKAIIELPIGRDPSSRQKMAVLPGGRKAETKFSIRRSSGSYALLEIMPLTGRTHQIRVHMAYLGLPVVGDEIYGLRKKIEIRQMLHAWKLSFKHPRTHRNVTYTAPVPDDIRDMWNNINGGIHEDF